MTTTGAQPQSTPAGAKPTLAAPAPHPQGSAAPSSSSSSGPPRYLPWGLGLLAGGCPGGRGAPPFRAPVAATLHRGGRGEGGHRLLPAGQRSGAGRSRGGHRLSPPLPALSRRGGGGGGGAGLLCAARPFPGRRAWRCPGVCEAAGARRGRGAMRRLQPGVALLLSLLWEVRPGRGRPRWAPRPPRSGEGGEELRRVSPPAATCLLPAVVCVFLGSPRGGSPRAGLGQGAAGRGTGLVGAGSGDRGLALRAGVFQEG